ncbi:hypothetical protein GIW78_07195 [Pseudomonas syringae]|nr:hypothetical protein [Pseudomonas syringae]MCF5183373.1 hypothetical protein [Pseudomonas syringae]MCF5314433.1 hypothetical protein [Pseudomonas syringae]MCF5361853.1 hypothetical protein [Pseudomonas syringae]MCF5397160.1 hypothetical protein [Pseudomonas syringae]
MPGNAGMSNLFISNVVFDFDESKSIDSLSSCMSPDELKAFRAGGFEYYVNESRDVYAVCEKAAAKVLDESHVGREDVTDIVYISSTKFIDKVVGLSVYLSKLAANIGIHKATLYALSAGECGNFVHALRFCGQILQERPDSKVLLVFAEKLMTDEERHYPGTAILSDGVAVCLVTCEKTRNCYEVIARSEATDHRVTKAYAEQKNIDALRLALTAIHTLSRDIFLKVDFDKSAISHFITNNFIMHLSKMYIMEVGGDASKLRLPTRPPKAHVFTIDSLLNLTGTPMDDGDLAFCLSFGMFFWGACIVKYHA